MKYIFLSSAIICNVIGQFSLKHGVNLYTEKFNSLNIVNVLFTKYVFLGFILYGISALFWIKAISKINLNIAYPTLAFGYVIIYFISGLILKEPIYTRGIIGIIFILMGIILIHLK